MRPFLARISMALNTLTGGERDQYLCQRISMKRGSWCLFCRVVGWALREPFHCLDQKMDWLRRR